MHSCCRSLLTRGTRAVRFTDAERKTAAQTPPYSPLNLREKLGLKDASRLEWLRDLSPEEEAFLGEVDQDVTDDLTQVHPTDHLFKPEPRREAAEQGGEPLTRIYDCPSRVWPRSHACPVCPHAGRGGSGKPSTLPTPIPPAVTENSARRPSPQ